MTDFVAECEKCGIIERGSLEEAGDAADAHERFHDVRVKRVATDGGSKLRCASCRATVTLDDTIELQVPEIGEGTIARIRVCEDCRPDTGNKRPVTAYKDLLKEVIKRANGIEEEQATLGDSELMTDGGHEDEEYYVLDEDRSAVVAGPFQSKERASEEATDRGPGHVVATDRVIEMVELTSTATIRWENEDVDVLTDGGVPKGVVTCTNCGTDSPLSEVLETGRCPSCDEKIDPDAPARIRSDLVDDAGWDKLHGEDYEPIGGTDFGADEVSEPDRDVGSITETLVDVERGDKIEVTIGAAEANSDAVLLIVSHERDVAGFDHRINFIEKPREDGWTRMYITAIGDDKFDPWEVVSAPYEVGTGTADMRDFAANGWLIDVEVTDAELTPVPRNPDRDVDDRRPMTDGGRDQLTPADRLREAVKQIRTAREDLGHGPRPAQDAQLARSEYAIRGVADALEDEGDDDSLDPSLLTDGGHVPGPSPDPVHPAPDPETEAGVRDFVCPGCDTAFHGQPEFIVEETWSLYCSRECFVQEEQYLRGQLHFCDICSQEFRSIQRLAHHDCGLQPPLLTDGGEDVDEWTVRQRGIDGNAPRGQTTLDGGVQKPRGDRDDE